MQRTPDLSGESEMGKRIGLAVFALVAMVSTVWAAEAEYSGIFCAHVKRTVLESGPDLTVSQQESWGISTPGSTTKAWENSTVHCIGYVRMMAGKRTAKGSCRWVDSGGDMFIGEWVDEPGQPGVWTFLAGTGKWKGIHGGGTYKNVSAGKLGEDGSIQVCNSHNGKYTLP